MLLHFSYGTGNKGSTSRSNSGLLGGSVAECDRLGEESGSLAMRSVQYRRVLPQWRCSIERIPPRRLARPISQTCTRRLCSRGFGARLLASPSPIDAPKLRASRTPRASSRGFHANIKIYYELLKIKSKKSAGGAWPNCWGEASSR